MIIPLILLAWVALFTRHRYAYPYSAWHRLHRSCHWSGYCLLVMGSVWIYPADAPGRHSLPDRAALTLVALNKQFYLFLAGERGKLFALAAIPFHLLYFASSGMAFLLASIRLPLGFGSRLRACRKGESGRAMMTSAILTYHSLDASRLGHFGSARKSSGRTSSRSPIPASPWSRSAAFSNSPGAVALTFDDGFRNLAEHAFPLLDRLRMPATVFVVSRYAGSQNEWPSQPASGVPRLPLLDWRELGNMPSGVTAGRPYRYASAFDQPFRVLSAARNPRIGRGNHVAYRPLAEGSCVSLWQRFPSGRLDCRQVFRSCRWH